jgi:hypothetical protein
MKRFLGFLGILALATSLTSGRNTKLNARGIMNLAAGEGGVAPVFIVPAPGQKGLRTRSTLPVNSFRSPLVPSIEPCLPEATKQPIAQPSWLTELNQWRRMAGLSGVTENARLSHGSEEHARYLVVQGPANTTAFRAYDRSLGPGAHLENSRSPSYTATGAEAAIGGPLAADVIQGADVAWEGRTESSDIDNLIAAPFHRLSLLAPWAQLGGYGSFGAYPRRAAALALRGPLEAYQNQQPIEFPPANDNISINALGGSEWPNPIASCAGYQRPVGLPITLQTGRLILLQSYSLSDQTSGDAVCACGFDAASYRNSDATEQKRGHELLDAYGAVMLIPRKPLVLGRQYRVSMQTSQGNFEWAFRLGDAAEIETAQTHRAAIKQLAASR